MIRHNVDEFRLQRQGFDSVFVVILDAHTVCMYVIEKYISLATVCI